MEGFVFDGFFICGWKGIQVFDMVMVLDVNIVWVDFFYRYKILSMICLIQELCIGQFYECCFCVLVQWVLNYLVSIGLVDMVFFGFELEFFFFDDVCYNLVEGGFFYSVDMIEVGWNIGWIEEGGNFVYKIQVKEGYFFVVFNDIVQDICFEMFLLMGQLGIFIEKYYYEVVGVGQYEFGMKFVELIQVVDNVMIYKYVVCNVVKKYGKMVIFMFKLVFNDNGIGMYVYQSFWKGGQFLFFGEGIYVNFLQMVCWYIGGIFKYVFVFLVFINFIINSYKCLVFGFEVLVNFVYFEGNCFVVVWILFIGLSLKVKCFEFCFGDVFVNFYLVFSVMMMVGLDGIKNQIDFGDGEDCDLFEFLVEEFLKIVMVFVFFNGVLEVLNVDCGFFIVGGVFSDDFIDNWIDLKYEEVQQLCQWLYFYEFIMYYDV